MSLDCKLSYNETDNDLYDADCEEHEFEVLENEMDFEEEERIAEDMNFIRNITEDELHLRNFNENHFNITENSSYAIVTTGRGQTVVRKSSSVWLFSKTTNNLSSDRLVRVKDMQIKKRDNIKTLQRNVDVMDDVSVGDWAVFKDSNVFLIGLVLNFKYVTVEMKQYSREFAHVRYSKDDGNE